MALSGRSYSLPALRRGVGPGRGRAHGTPPRGDRGLAGLDRVAVAAAYATSGLMLGLASALVTALRAHGCSARWPFL